MKVLDLFSGIGGFTLGLERAGFETMAFCEIDSYCQKILKKNWPEIPIHNDIRNISKKDFKERIDLICGGFPCQDISVANTKGIGIEGKKSNLWLEYKRLIKEIKPRWVIIENVANLRNRGLGQVIKDLHEIGYNCEWHIIPAYAVGLPHERERIWIVAYPIVSKYESQKTAKRAQKSKYDGSKNPSKIAGVLSNSLYKGLEGFFHPQKTKKFPVLADILSKKIQKIERKTEPRICRVVDGVPNWSHRIRCLGNAVVPQIPELIGKSILEYEKNRKIK